MREVSCWRSSRRGRCRCRPAGQVWRRFFIQACLNSVVPFTLIAWAEQKTDAGLATILNSTSPIFTVLITTTFLRKPISMSQSIGAIIGLVGTCLVIGIEATASLGEALPAQLAIVVATICYAVAVLYGRAFKELDPIMPAAGSLICGALLLAPISLCLDRPWQIVPSMQSLIALGCLSVFSTALALIIYFKLLKTLGSVGTTAQAYLRVPIGVSIGVLCLGETLTSTALIGLVFIVIGVFAMTRPERKVATA